MAASLYHPDTVTRSEKHDGSGEVPGLKDGDGRWDTRPHAERIIEVDEKLLAVWADILDEPGTPPVQARMVYPVNRASSRVLERLSKAPRVRELGLQYSSGWNETTGRKNGYFEIGSKVNESWDDVILQGPHFTVANPFYKVPNPSMRSNQDWTEIDLEALPADFIPRTSYQPAGDRSAYISNYGKWRAADAADVSVTQFHRIAWRRMASTTGKRTLHVTIIPPGAAHVDAVISAIPSLGKSQLPMLICLATMGSILSDFFVKVAGVGDLRRPVIDSLPTIQWTGSLADHEIVSRLIGLVGLTDALNGLVREVESEGVFVRPVARAATERRILEVEIDVLVAIRFGISTEELCAIYRAQFPVLRGYEQNDLYDVNGRKVPGEINKAYRKLGESLSIEDRTWTHPQSQVEYVFEFPFRSFDREDDMRTAYAHFEKMLESEQS